jgi:OmcA/MtrC family decaheme c-type cytochrome
MDHRRSAAYLFNLIGVVGSALFVLAGCSGSDGSAGAAGSNAVATVPASALTTTSTLKMAVTGVTVASPPVVTFKATDQNGTPVSGLLPANLRFTIAKLTPGSAANGNLSNWQNYVLRVSGGRVQGNRETPTATNLKDNGDGSYTYTFQTNITNVTCPAPCKDSYGNTLDVSYDPTLTHRVGIQIARGSTTLPLSNTTYTFRPSDGATTGITQRDIVKTARCNECHGTLQAHDQRIETKYCVTCHNPGTTANGQTGTQTGDTPVDFRVLIHKLHNAPELPSVLGPDGILNTADDGDYGVIGFSGALTSFKDVEFPQNNTNCVKCHGNGTDPETPQGDNWKNRPNMYACGACHDNVYFGATTTNPDQTVAHKDFLVVGVPVGPLTDNSTCATCHTPTVIQTLHVPVEVTNSTPGSEAARAAYQDNLPAGASKMSYEIKASGVTVSGTPKRATVVFRVLRDGVAQTFNTFGAGVKLMNDFSLTAGATTSPGNAGPAFYLAYAVPQDAITAPTDFNVSANISLLNVWDGTRGTLSGPDGSGYYTAVLGGGTSNYPNMDIPASAVMVTAGFGFGAFVQMNVAGYPGGLTLITPVTQQIAAGYTARRVIAAKEKCNACHATLGTDPTFHGGNRNDPTVCAFCHYAGRTSNGWSGRSNSFIHAIHGASKRTVNFTWHGTKAAAPVLIDTGFWQILFPGILNKCETCHVPGAYDFSGSAYTDALMSNLPYTINATGIMSPTEFTRSPYVDSTGTVDYGVNFSYNTATGVTTQAAGTTLATSPIATACFACHDSGIARAHMESNGASIYQPRSTALTKTETCLVCHGPGKIAAIADMHAK